jgi:hypothetical protein
MFHARAADQAHAASVPDTTWPVIGHPPGPAPAARSMATVSMPLRERNDTSTAVRVHSSSWSPPGTPPVPFPHRSPRRSSANAACGGLEPPPEGRLRRAYLHLSHSTDSRRLTYLIKTSVRRSWRTPRRSLGMSVHAGMILRVAMGCVRSRPPSAHAGNTCRRLAERSVEQRM